MRWCRPLKSTKSSLIVNIINVINYFSDLAVRDAPLGDGWATTARNDDPVAFAGDGCQGNDAVEAKKPTPIPWKIASCNKEQVKVFI